ncbi:MAG: hypothetical protein QJR12_02245 [Mycobacterium sp.]|uniref:hypothetical protein n=1 Tax=Mycobacterium sp. TaxID=1785 RepID=UPI002639D212|nr:hypothetical protein [Mycobacterium sp.]MDI3313132.1 hypothetical protein [Mycobacterium sp.]
MGIAALISWIVTALGGSYMLAKWVAGGGHHGQNTKLSPSMVFGHFLSAAVGLLIWIAYLVTGNPAVAAAASLVLLLVATLGFIMLARWAATYYARQAVTEGAQPKTVGTPAEPEQSFPVAVVLLHGLLAVTTVTLVLFALFPLFSL